MSRYRHKRGIHVYTVVAFSLILATACGGQSEEEIQRRIDEAVAEALAEEASAVTTTDTSSPTTSTLVPTTSSSPETTTTIIATTTTIDPLSPDVVRSRFIEVAERDVAKVAERLPVEGITPDHHAEYQAPYTFDIEATDSIVSPFEGTLVIPMKWYYEGELTDLSLFLVARYQYTDFEWQFESAVRYLDRSTPDTSPTINQWAESLFR